jgi:glycine/D-amino acid oxidase-like deaminating enzyme
LDADFVMRICVIGAGIAGTLLAWRLAESTSVDRIDLVTGPPGTDATAASGGGVRGFETHPVQRRLAIDSLTELFDGLRETAGYTETRTRGRRNSWTATSSGDAAGTDCRTARSAFSSGAPASSAPTT